MIKAVKEEIYTDNKIIHGAPEGQDARILAERARVLMPHDRVLVHIALDDARLAALHELLSFFAPDAEVLEFPAWDCLPYDRVSPNADIVAHRMAALSSLMAWQADKRRKPRILLTTVNAALQRVPPRSVLENVRLDARAGDTLDMGGLLEFLSHNGYSRTETVREAGEFAIRGGIIDLFPSGYSNPVRLDLFGDQIESIREFDAMSQRSLGKVDGFTLQPVTEFFLSEDSIARFRSGYREAFGVVRDDDPLYEAVSSGRRYNGMEHWLPLFYEHLETVFDYVPQAGVTLDHHGLDSANERFTQVADFFAARRTLEKAAGEKKKKGQDVSLSGAVYHPLPPSALYLQEGEWNEFSQQAEIFSPFGSPSDVIPAQAGISSIVEPDPGFRRDDNYNGAKKGRDFADIRALPKGDVFGELAKYIRTLRDDQKILIAAYSEGAAARLQSLLESANIGPLVVIHEPEQFKKIKSHEIGLTVLGLEHGFLANDLAVITEADILGDRLARRSSKRKKADNFLTEISALSEGDLVVHVDHGVGRFVALETLEAGKTFHDCLKLEYAGGDRLYIPVENIDMLSRYGSDEGTAQLDKLGGAGWQARKARVKKDLMAMADKLLEIAAARQLKKADKLEIEPAIYTEFAARFPYAETEDQDRAITDTLESMAKDYPMDRLICGDVGFGKTEVALRAAYVAAKAGVQVALVVPTTLLSRQHYNNFIKRFEGTGIRIGQLSRLVAAKDAKIVKDGLADGTVNIVIGTHALFSDSVKFADLGLLIVDEEQRFGVKQKEKLKELKAGVHVLTLTATPIPRTLQMSLTGVKEMSIMASPPVDRLAVRTFVLPYDPMVIREALLREHYRGGQSFYVCPRIKDMAALEAELKELVPEIKVISAHGQMTPAELEDRMTAFYDGQYEVLLATNIIESGIDIPTANTMVIHRADMFGLAQLYQIRGRIGRSKMRAYAYLTYPPNQILNDHAMKRLEVMETLDTLGSGFQLASHDMDIRGAGNLLGEQQSGHIKEIGVELYQQMLEEAVAAAREGTSLEAVQDERWSPQINLGTSVLIPETYVEDLNVRMSLYRRIAELGNSASSSRWREAEGRTRTNGIRGSEPQSGSPCGSPLSKPAAQAAGMTGEVDDMQGEIDSFAAELIDRFGKLPEEVENLLDIVAIKQLCRKAGISHVDAGPKGAVLTFHNNAPPNVPALMVWMQEKGGAVKLRPDQKLVAIRGWENLEKRVKGVQSLMKELASL